MRTNFYCSLLLVLLSLPSVVASAQLSVRNASGRILPDGVLDEAAWDNADWLVVYYKDAINPEYHAAFSSNEKAVMAASLLYDTRCIYVGIKVAMGKMHTFPITTIEFWLGNVEFFVGRNVFGEDLFQWIKGDGDEAIAGVPPRSRIGMQKVDDLDPQDRFGLIGITGYCIEIAVALSELEEMLGKTIEADMNLSFAVGYCQPLETEGTKLRDGLIYYPNSWIPHDLSTYGTIVFE